MHYLFHRCSRISFKILRWKFYEKKQFLVNAPKFAPIINRDYLTKKNFIKNSILSLLILFFFNLHTKLLQYVHANAQWVNPKIYCLHIQWLRWQNLHIPFLIFLIQRYGAVLRVSWLLGYRGGGILALRVKI